MGEYHGLRLYGHGFICFYCRGSAYTPSGTGADCLLLDCAHLVLSAPDIPEGLGVASSGGKTETLSRQALPVNENERRVLALLTLMALLLRKFPYYGVDRKL